MPSMPKTFRPAAQVAAPDVQRGYDQARGSAAARGYDRRWRAAREQFLREHPLCVRCEAEGRVVAAEVVDHITPHRGDPALFWRRSNWQPLCKPCHDHKTATEDGAFGRPAKAAGEGGGG